LNDSYIKANGLDAHTIKMEYLGNKAQIARFDLYKTPSGQIVILPKGGNGTPIFTDYMINQ
jgi:filamentous hemagglutinin